LLTGVFFSASELAFSNHMCGLDPAQGCLREGERFRAFHLPSDPFNEPMVPIDDIAQVFDLQNLNETAPAAFHINVGLVHPSGTRRPCLSLRVVDAICSEYLSTHRFNVG
jgi:hypothetical protein